jgi:hypothetical protein
MFGFIENAFNLIKTKTMPKLSSNTKWVDSVKLMSRLTADINKSKTLLDLFI